VSRYAIIPARGGSKRLPGKNIRPFLGKPIIAYAIETARQSGLFSSVYVSTDDSAIAEVAFSYGARVLNRPAHLADDKAGTPAVMQYHATEFQLCRSSYLCCIHPTAVLMTVEDLHTGLTELKNFGADFAFGFADDPLRDTGSFYWGGTKAFASGDPWFGTGTLMIPIPPERACDINTIEDWSRAEAMYAALHRKAA